MSHYVLVSKKEKVRKRKSFLRRFALFLLLLIIVAISVSYCVYRRSMTPTILDIAKTRVQADATCAINEAVLFVLSSDVSYSDFVVVERNSQNEIVMISANTVKVNSLARNTSVVTQSKIESICKNTISIPFGTLSGIPLLNELGPSVNISLSPIGAVICTFVSKFECAGINQTLHRIYLNVESQVDLIVPTMHQVLQISTPILLSETIIVGEVPQTYLQGEFCLGASN